MATPFQLIDKVHETFRIPRSSIIDKQSEEKVNIFKEDGVIAKGVGEKERDFSVKPGKYLIEVTNTFQSLGRLFGSNPSIFITMKTSEMEDESDMPIYKQQTWSSQVIVPPGQSNDNIHLVLTSDDLKRDVPYKVQISQTFHVAFQRQGYIGYQETNKYQVKLNPGYYCLHASTNSNSAVKITYQYSDFVDQTADNVSGSNVFKSKEFPVRLSDEKRKMSFQVTGLTSGKDCFFTFKLLQSVGVQDMQELEDHEKNVMQQEFRTMIDDAVKEKDYEKLKLVISIVEDKGYAPLKRYGDEKLKEFHKKYKFSDKVYTLLQDLIQGSTLYHSEYSPQSTVISMSNQTTKSSSPFSSNNNNLLSSSSSLSPSSSSSSSSSSFRGIPTTTTTKSSLSSSNTTNISSSFVQKKNQTNSPISNNSSSFKFGSNGPSSQSISSVLSDIEDQQEEQLGYYLYTTYMVQLYVWMDQLLNAMKRTDKEHEWFKKEFEIFERTRKHYETSVKWIKELDFILSRPDAKEKSMESDPYALRNKFDRVIRQREDYYKQNNFSWQAPPLPKKKVSTSEGEKEKGSPENSKVERMDRKEMGEYPVVHYFLFKTMNQKLETAINESRYIIEKYELSQKLAGELKQYIERGVSISKVKNTLQNLDQLPAYCLDHNPVIQNLKKDAEELIQKSNLARYANNGLYSIVSKSASNITSSELGFFLKKQSEHLEKKFAEKANTLLNASLANDLKNVEKTRLSLYNDLELAMLIENEDEEDDSTAKEKGETTSNVSKIENEKKIDKAKETSNSGPEKRIKSGESKNEDSKDDNEDENINDDIDDGYGDSDEENVPIVGTEKNNILENILGEEDDEDVTKNDDKKETEMANINDILDEVEYEEDMQASILDQNPTSTIANDKKQSDVTASEESNQTKTNRIITRRGKGPTIKRVIGGTKISNVPSPAENKSEMVMKSNNGHADGVRRISIIKSSATEMDKLRESSPVDTNKAPINNNPSKEKEEEIKQIDVSNSKHGNASLQQIEEFNNIEDKKKANFVSNGSNQVIMIPKHSEQKEIKQHDITQKQSIPIDKADKQNATTSAPPVAKLPDRMVDDRDLIKGIKILTDVKKKSDWINRVQNGEMHIHMKRRQMHSHPLLDNFHNYLLQAIIITTGGTTGSEEANPHPQGELSRSGASKAKRKYEPYTIRRDTPFGKNVVDTLYEIMRYRLRPHYSLFGYVKKDRTLFDVFSQFNQIDVKRAVRYFNQHQYARIDAFSEESKVFLQFILETGDFIPIVHLLLQSELYLKTCYHDDSFLVSPMYRDELTSLLLLLQQLKFQLGFLKNISTRPMSQSATVVNAQNVQIAAMKASKISASTSSSDSTNNIKLATNDSTRVSTSSDSEVTKGKSNQQSNQSNSNSKNSSRNVSPSSSFTSETTKRSEVDEKLALINKLCKQIVNFYIEEKKKNERVSLKTTVSDFHYYEMHLQKLKTGQLKPSDPSSNIIPSHPIGTMVRRKLCKYLEYILNDGTKLRGALNHTGYYHVWNAIEYLGKHINSLGESHVSSLEVEFGKAIDHVVTSVKKKIKKKQHNDEPYSLELDLISNQNTAKFKAFICYALNEARLFDFIVNVFLRHGDILRKFYKPNSIWFRYHQEQEDPSSQSAEDDTRNQGMVPATPIIEKLSKYLNVLSKLPFYLDCEHEQIFEHACGK